MLHATHCSLFLKFYKILTKMCHKTTENISRNNIVNIVDKYY